MVQTIGQAIAKRSPDQTGRNGKTVEDVWQRAVRSVDGMDLNVFSELMSGLWAGCGRTASPDKTTLRVWYFCLHDLTEQQMSHAVMAYLTTRSKEYLTVQLIRELSGLQQAKEVAAMAAWDSSVEAVRIAGGYAVPLFADPITSNVIQNLGGWVWFCDQHPEQLRGFVRARFLKSYDVLAGSGRAVAAARLTSLTELTGGTTEIVPIGYKSCDKIGSNRSRSIGEMIDEGHEWRPSNANHHRPDAGGILRGVVSHGKKAENRETSRNSLADPT